MKMQTQCFGYTGALSAELIAFAKRQFVNATLYKGDQRRREDRYPMIVPVLGVPVNNDHQPIGDPFEMITRDVGASSIGFVHEEQILHELIAIHLVLAGTEVDLVIQLQWSEPLGPFYGSGGSYRKRLEQFPCPLDYAVDCVNCSPGTEA